MALGFVARGTCVGLCCKSRRPRIDDVASAGEQPDFAFTTDSVSAAGAPPGRYRLGELEVVVGPDRVVMHPDGKGFAGSGLTMVEGLLNVVRLGGLDVAGAWRGWTRLRSELFPQAETPRAAVPWSAPAAAAALPRQGRA